MEQAGAERDRIEHLFAGDRPFPDGSGDVEKDYCELVRRLRENLTIPIAVKLSPFYSAMANFASQLDASGANALVLFNRFYQPDLDIEQLDVVPSLTLSHPSELLLRLHWVAVIYGHIRRGHRRYRRCALRGGCFEIGDGRRTRGDDGLRAVGQWRRIS